MTQRIQLPEGHSWTEFETGMAQLFGWECACGATFTHDVESNETEYEEGDGHDDEEEEAEESPA